MPGHFLWHLEGLAETGGWDDSWGCMVNTKAHITWKHRITHECKQTQAQTKWTKNTGFRETSESVSSYEGSKEETEASFLRCIREGTWQLPPRPISLPRCHQFFVCYFYPAGARRIIHKSRPRFVLHLNKIIMRIKIIMKNTNPLCQVHGENKF